MVARRLFLTAACLLALRCRNLLPDQYPETTARVVLEKYDQAWLSKNVKAFNALLSPSYVYFTSSGRVMDRGEMLNMLGSNGYKIDSGSRDDVRVLVTESTAILSTRWRGKGTYEGKPFVDDQRCSVVISLGFKPEVLSEHCTNVL